MQFVECILEMRPKNAQNRLQMLFRSLHTREQLRNTQKALQILRATGMIRIFNRLKNGLKKIHREPSFIRQATGARQGGFRIQEQETGDRIQNSEALECWSAEF